MTRGTRGASGLCRLTTRMTRGPVVVIHCRKPQPPAPLVHPMVQVSRWRGGWASIPRLCGARQVLPRRFVPSRVPLSATGYRVSNISPATHPCGNGKLLFRSCVAPRRMSNPHATDRSTVIVRSGMVYPLHNSSGISSAWRRSDSAASSSPAPKRVSANTIRRWFLHCHT